MTKHPVRLMLDSGAYSCWRKGEVLDVERYGEFILEHKDYVNQVVNLDVIPGEFGRVPSAYEVEKSADQGHGNLLKLREMGIEAMPVFHQGESLSYLEQMLQEKFDYIGISPANDRTTKQKRAWLDEVFEYLCGSKGFPSAKTHAFGVTALDLVDEYPWFSYDSITWVLIAAYGAILVPSHEGNEISYVRPPHVVFFSEAPRKRPEYLSTTGRHIRQFGPRFQNYVREWVRSVGLDPDTLGDSYIHRQEVCAKFFMEVEKAGKTKKFVRKTGGFYTKHQTDHGVETPIASKPRKIFTCSTAATHSRILQDFGQRDRLLSYFYWKDSTPFDLKRYVREGLVPRKRDLKPTAEVEPPKSTITRVYLKQ